MHSLSLRLFNHKKLVAFLLLASVGGLYWGYSSFYASDEAAKYVLGTVQKKTIVASISASGQVAASDDADVKAKVSGDITAVYGKVGQAVRAGQALAAIESVSAQAAVRDARLAVEEAKLNLEHDSLQAPIDFKKLEEDLARAERDRADAIGDAYSALSDAYIKLPDVVSGADGILYDSDIAPNVENVNSYISFFISSPADQDTIRVLAARAESDYTLARTAYTKGLASFQALSRTSSTESTQAALVESRTAAALLAKAVVSESNLIDTTIDILERRSWNVPAAVTVAQTDVRTYVASANTVLTNLSSAEKSIQTARDAITDAEHAIDLAKVGNASGVDPFELKLTENALKQKEAALIDAQQALADHTIRAPFDGVLASLSIQRGDSVSSNAAVGSLISNQRIAELSLNEVDVAKVQIGQKATLTFDAIEELTLTGKVAEIDSVGTITQGVVPYVVKIALDAQDDRVKPGMTVNASIVLGVYPDVLSVPVSAVKTQGAQKYVLVFDPALPELGDAQGVDAPTTPVQRPVTVGASDDTSIEILSGLTEGQQIVTRTISASAANTTTSSARAGATGGPPIRF